MDRNLELLENIQKVDAPPFLLTRIKQQIENSNYSKFSSKFTLSLGLSFLVLLILNTSIILHHKNHQKDEKQIANSFGLMLNNSLYNE
ncbi:MAG: hypothetical protein NTW25_13695 [Candidatus Kapabacteria bacterium]|nr:hypothetical protein [Candidatus Kapabacteria bacterium]